MTRAAIPSDYKFHLFGLRHQRLRFTTLADGATRERRSTWLASADPRKTGCGFTLRRADAALVQRLRQGARERDGQERAPRVTASLIGTWSAQHRSGWQMERADLHGHPAESMEHREGVDMAKRNGVSGRLWLAMLSEGGRLTAIQAAKLVNETDNANARSVLYAMVEGGSVRKFDPPTGKQGAKFGVTLECKIPNGVTVGDVLDALQQEAA